MPAQDQQTPEYAESETCSFCHTDLHESFMKLGHAVLEKSTKLGYAGRACEACHGPGLNHAENEGDISKIFSFNRASKQEQEKACLECHGMMASHAGSQASLHSRGGGPSCMECHSIHGSEATTLFLKKEPTQLCLGCHIERKSDFRRPYHHKVLEGGMSCIDCHRPHGGSLPRQLKSAGGTPMPCVRCHTDKAGPFVFEHASMRLGDCISCHVPHGSSNPKMLVRNTVQALCLECHSFSPGIPGPQPPAFHDQRTIRYRNCTICHMKIHGSNASRVFLR